MTELRQKLAQAFPKSRRGFYRMLAIKATLVGAIALIDAQIDHPSVKMASCTAKIALATSEHWEMQRLRETLEKKRRETKE